MVFSFFDKDRSQPFFLQVVYLPLTGGKYDSSKLFINWLDHSEVANPAQWLIATCWLLHFNFPYFDCFPQFS